MFTAPGFDPCTRPVRTPTVNDPKEADGTTSNQRHPYRFVFAFGSRTTPGETVIFSRRTNRTDFLLAKEASLLPTPRRTL
eukprot:8094699-Pyramimonas_sp.AAC.1